jgi:4-diphosphocytidyl-2-C-methyl-D-erythritol kinase
MGSVRVLKAPAKVNLHLEILGRRGDGFHEILSVFQAVSLYDRVALRSLKVTGQLSVRCTLPIPAEQNIVTAAVRRFRERTGIEAGVAVSLRKAIPVGAGLGGGSSDAAATLRGMNEMFGGPLGRSELVALAAALGSDVPFFLGGPTALVEGRGERLTSLPGRADYQVVLVWPGFGVATREAYRWFDEQEQGAGASAHLSAEEVRRRFTGWEPGRWGFFNSFRGVVEARHPLLGEIVRDLREAGAGVAGLSGCGSTVFGLFAGTRQARAAAARARRRYPLVEVVSPLQIRGTQD